MTISVTQLNNYIKGVVDLDGILSNLSVCGEVTNLKRYGEGYYFSLKDENSAMNCFCYCANTLTQGEVVVAEGSLSYFVKNGSISLYVKRITSTKNTGEAYLRFVELKEKLQKEGLFDADRKKPIPSYCQRVGIVTSPTGAVIVDITNVVLRRQPNCNLFLYPVKVQGDGAESQIVEGIEHFSNSDVDVVIVGRGGGSNEDLSVFNSESVVRAIARCNKPVLSAVGHGVDYTLADFVADRRAVTPSEAGEFVTIDVNATKRHILARLSKMQTQLQARVSYDLQRLTNWQKISTSKLAYRIERGVDFVKGNLANSNQALQHLLSQRQMRLDNAISRLSASNPANLLKRGYAVVTVGGELVKSVKALQEGDTVKIQFADGSVDAVVGKKEIK